MENNQQEVTLHESQSNNEKDKKFHEIVSALEESLVNEEFINRQQEFIDQNCSVFLDEEENKLEYMDLFKEYVALMENMLEIQMQQRVDNFDLTEFINIIEERQEEISDDIWNALIEFTDFEEFKKMMLSHKKGGDVSLEGVFAVGQIWVNNNNNNSNTE